jgi:flagella basal body P-ring formation protein FlgA
MRKLPFILLLAMTSSHGHATTTSQHVAPDRLVAAARAQLDAQLGNDRAASQVFLVGMPEDAVLPVGKLDLKTHPLKGRWPRSRVGVPVEIHLNGQAMRSATVWFSVSVQGAVLKYAVDAPMGGQAASLKLVPGQADIAQLQGDLIREPHDIDGMRLRHPVLAGAIATRDDFVRVPDVDREQRVRVMEAYRSVHLEARGTASGQGNVGDVVAVLVDGTEVPVHARITDKGVVEVVQ